MIRHHPLFGYIILVKKCTIKTDCLLYIIHITFKIQYRVVSMYVVLRIDVIAYVGILE